MLNLLKQTKPWMVASLLVATSVFGQDSGKCAPKSESCKPCPKPCPAPCPQPNPPTQMCPPTPNPCCPAWPVPVLNAAYNYPARTMTRCPWDVYFDASFIYWQPIEENLELAASVGPISSTGVIDGYLIQQQNNYKPGFKVGMGGNFDYDNWDLHAEYTWFHGSNSTSATAPSGRVLAQVQGSPLNIVNGTAALTPYSNVDQTWRLKMDIAELTLGRWQYVGTKLTFRPSFGARAAWIRQKLQNNIYQVSSGTTVAEQEFTRNSTSWAIGPQMGLDSNWMLGEGFRFYGCGEADILYTRYNRLSDSHMNEITGDITTTKERDYGTVRTHVDLELGFGWGTYIDCNNWYMDFTAGYGFQVFFDQNMFRRFNEVSSTVPSYLSQLPNGNLYVQGMTLTFRLDF